MTEQDLFIKRLNEELQNSNLERKDIIERVGINKGTLSSYLSGKYMPKNIVMKKLADIFNISPSYLAGLSNDKNENIPTYNSETGVLTIPFINQKLSAGIGEDWLTPENMEIKKIDILEHMARGIDKKTLVAAEVKGDSMIEANIHSGDIVVFSKGLVEQEGIYVINYAGDIMVKNLSFDSLNNTIDIISRNKEYPIRTVNADMVDILGKVVGWIHSIR